MAEKQERLTEEQRAFVVQGLACFDSPSVVAEALRKEYGASITPQSVEAYDPTKRAGRNLAQRWVDLFHEARKQFLDDLTHIGISHKAVRLRALDRMAARAEKQGNLALAASLHEQAAKELGNTFTNKRELTGKDGKDLPAGSNVTVYQLPDNGR